MSETVEVNENQRGALGEILVVGGRMTPVPLQDAIIEFIRETYEVGDPAGFQFSLDSGIYLKARTVDGEQVGWQTDGLVACTWISPDKSENIERVTAGGFNEMRPQDEEAAFPIDVKTGEYAEMSDSQQAVADAVAQANTNIHPIIASVGIDGLPEEYTLSVRILSR